MKKKGNTIVDMQLRNVLLPIIKGKKKLRANMVYPKLSRIFVIAGNPASGKDEIIRALLTFGKLQAKVLPKYEKEIICQYIPRKEYLEKFRQDYQKEEDKIIQNLSKIDEDFKSAYQREFIDFNQKLEEKTLGLEFMKKKIAVMLYMEMIIGYMEIKKKKE